VARDRVDGPKNTKAASAGAASGNCDKRAILGRRGVPAVPKSRGSSVSISAPDPGRSGLRTEKFVLNRVIEQVSRVACENRKAFFPVPVADSCDQPVAQEFDGIAIGRCR
jgi:hypothetical protein